MSGAIPLVDLEATQGHIGSALLALDGSVIRLGGKMSEENASILFKILVEVAMLGSDDNFKRLVVSFASCNFSLARDADHVYILQTKMS
mmetsp:Transcript_37688/g.43048  ORF Transcript_37688/g.43048 Transcript_37688/m.43048 type:complete len:89 (+) Transcript_37688:81-347(+)